MQYQNNMQLPGVIYALVDHLKKDQEYYSTWQANIAQSVSDELKSNADFFKTAKGSGVNDLIYAISNNSAIRFLNLLCNKEPNKFESRFNIGDHVSFSTQFAPNKEYDGMVFGVYFTESKVYYSIVDKESTHFTDIPSDLVNPLK